MCLVSNGRVWRVEIRVFVWLCYDEVVQVQTGQGHLWASEAGSGTRSKVIGSNRHVHHGQGRHLEGCV